MIRDFPVSPQGVDVTAGLVTAAEPRRAATVILLQDNGISGKGLDVFLMRRTSSMAFAPGRYVFPGGGVDHNDYRSDHRDDHQDDGRDDNQDDGRDDNRDDDAARGDNLPWAGPSASQWADRLGVTAPDAAGVVCAAVRELFEECGVLLAAPKHDARSVSGSLIPDLTDPSWERDRLALIDRTLTLPQLLRRRGLQLRSDLLTAWSRWCTPVFEPRRYDTWFFMAALPPGQQARHLGGEADHAQWWSAADAATAGADGAMAMLPPTIITLNEVAAAPNVAALLGTSRQLRRVTPWLVRSVSGEVRVRVHLDGRGGGDPGPASGVEELTSNASGASDARDARDASGASIGGSDE